MRPADYDVERDTNKVQAKKTMKQLFAYLWPKDRSDLKTRLIIAVLLLVAAKVLNIYVPYLLKLTIDDLSLDEGLKLLPLALIVAYGLARLGVSVFGELRDLVFVKVVQHVQRTVSLATFEHLHGLSLDFHLSRQTGGLSRIIERGTRSIQFILRFLTFSIIPTLLEIAMVTGVLVYNFDYSYALIILVTIGLYILVTLVITEWRLKFRKTMNAKESKANTSAIDSLINFETVKYFGNEEHEFRRFDKSLAEYESAAVQSQSSLSLLNVLQVLVICTGLVLILVRAGQGVVDGSMTIGDFVLVNTYMIQIYVPLGFLGFIYREFKNSLVDMEKMFELKQVQSSIQDAPNAADVPKDMDPSVEFKNVHFSYNPDREILKGVSFKVLAGKNVAIVGSSGSGKSTIARLLFRFYDVQQGEICFDSHELSQFKQQSLRSKISVVPQDTVLFNDTIGYNIAYGFPQASQEDVVEAAKLAQIHTFVSGLPKGYETQVGERGLKLSGGEKQRVAIARALLKQPKILVFDEATSSLDTHTEQNILNAFKEISKRYTTISIAHRLSTIVDSDEILVLDAGQIVERGTHAELVSANGVYKAMWESQISEASNK